MSDKYIVTTSGNWEVNVHYFNCLQKAKECYNYSSGSKTLAQVIEFNHNSFPEDKRPDWIKNAVIIWNDRHGFSENWERIFREEYDFQNHIQMYKDNFGHAYLLPKGRVLIHNNESGYSIGVFKE